MRWRSRRAKALAKAGAKDEAKKKWHKWFAWYPIEISGGCYWLEIVERQWVPRTFGFRGMPYWDYRKPPFHSRRKVKLAKKS